MDKSVIRDNDGGNSTYWSVAKQVGEVGNRREFSGPMTYVGIRSGGSCWYSLVFIDSRGIGD